MQRQHNRDDWYRCRACGHKLFRYRGSLEGTRIEIKCHSCKEVIIIGEDEEIAKEDKCCAE